MLLPTQQPEAAAYRWRWPALVGLLVAEAMNLLDSTIVQVVAPTIQRDLGGSLSDVQWYATAYTLPFALLLITGGRLGDIAGRKRTFRLGVALFLLASLACALAPSSGALIAFRVVQGAAAAVIIPQTIGLIKAMFTGPEMSRALGSIGPVMGLAAVGGPVLGGLITHADVLGSSWRAAFLVNVPLSLAVLAIAPALLEDRAPRRRGLDPAGTALLMAGTALVVYPLIRAGAAPMSGGAWSAIGAGLALTLAFAAHQRHRARTGGRPLVEVSLFTRRVFPAALATSTLFFAITTGLSLVVVLHTQLGAGKGVLTAALTLLPWTVGMGAASYLAGARLGTRHGNRLMFVGLAVLLCGVLAAGVPLREATPGRYPVPLLAALAVIGIGVGLFTATFFTAALHAVDTQEVGSAAGLLNAVQQLGATLGVAVLGSIYLRTAKPATGPQGLHAAQYAFLTAAALLVVTAATAAAMSVSPRQATRNTAASARRDGRT